MNKKNQSDEDRGLSNSDQQQQLHLLAETSLQLNQIETSSEVAEFVCQQVKNMIGKGYVAVSLQDKSTQMLSIKALRGFEDDSLVNAVLRLIGTDPRKMQASVKSFSPGELARYKSGRLEFLEDGLYELLFRKYPRAVCNALSQLLGIRYVYSMGFVNHEQHVGGIAILAHSRTAVENHRFVIENILAQAGAIIRRMKVEEALKESEIIFSSFLEHSPVYVFLKDENIRCLRLSRNFEQLLGIPLTQALGKTMEELFPSELARSMVLDDKRILSTGEVVKVTEEMNGRFYETTKFPILKNNKPAMLAGFTIDITARQKAEDDLNSAYAEEKKLRQQLEEEAKARIRFIDVLAHELKGPLTPMLAASGLLKDLLETSPGSAHKKLADNIFTGTQLLSGRLEELLEVARFVRGNINLNLEPASLRVFISQIVSRYSVSIEQRKQMLLTDIAEDLPLVQIDPSHLEQVMVNLLSNASKYSPEGSRINISASKQNGFIQIDVKDEGIGISVEDQSKLFQPYQRVGPVQQNIKGLGLGLAVVKSIVEAHGGQVWVESEPGKGSTFSFSIPLK
jgi:PAS domain S-box-containing protein